MSLLRYLKQNPLDTVILEKNKIHDRRSDHRTLYIPGDNTVNLKHFPLVVVMNDHQTYLSLVENLNGREFHEASRAYFLEDLQKERYRIQIFTDLETGTGLSMRFSTYHSEKPIPPMRWVPNIDYQSKTSHWIK